MLDFLNSPLTIGNLTLSNRLIQGPLAGYSASPMRKLAYQFKPPAYLVTEMISANDILDKHEANSRYLHRASVEKILSFQISGIDPQLMAAAAEKLADYGADLIDINCGCPKAKIRKKGAGSALLETPLQLLAITKAVRAKLRIPLTIKIRIQKSEKEDLELARALEESGVDALIIHGRHWQDDYDKPVNLERIAAIKKAIKIPVIANGDILDDLSLDKTLRTTAADAYMIGRAGTGKPWLYETLLNGKRPLIGETKVKALFMQHLDDLASLENEHQALLQSRSLFRYYFGKTFDKVILNQFYQLKSLKEIENYLITVEGFL